MRIGLDARTLTAPRPRGTGRNLLDAYTWIPALRPDWEFVLYYRRAVPPEHPLARLAERHANVRLRRMDMPGDRLDAWFHVRLPLAATQDGIDVLHAPANAAPTWCPVPLVVTIHDLIPLKLPGELPARITRAFERGVRRAVQQAARLIAVSESTREDLAEEFGVSRAGVSVIPWAPDQEIVRRVARSGRAALAHEARGKYGLGARWLLLFAGQTRRKNAETALAGFAAVPEDRRQDVQFVLIGCEQPARRAQLAAQAAELGLETATRVLGFVPHEDLPGLLGGAAGLVLPSYYEGFGLPILDAFACGVPVLASEVSSLPEVGGDAVLYCRPADPLSIAGGLARLLDPQLGAALVERGRVRVREFTWEATARAMCGVYAACAGTAAETDLSLAEVRS